MPKQNQIRILVNQFDVMICIQLNFIQFFVEYNLIISFMIVFCALSLREEDEEEKVKEE